MGKRSRTHLDDFLARLDFEGGGGGGGVMSDPFVSENQIYTLHVEEPCERDPLSQAFRGSRIESGIVVPKDVA